MHYTAFDRCSILAVQGFVAGGEIHRAGSELADARTGAHRLVVDPNFVLACQVCKPALVKARREAGAGGLQGLAVAAAAQVD